MSYYNNVMIKRREKLLRIKSVDIAYDSIEWAPVITIE